MTIKKGDQVKIMRGKDRGKTGSVLHVFPRKNRVTIEGFNLFKKRVRPKKQGQAGETVQVPRPMNVSNVMLVCRNCKVAARVGMRLEGNRKVRYCKKCTATT